MLTKKQIEELKPGTYKNSDLARLYKSHGSFRRDFKIPVDNNDNVIYNISTLLGGKHIKAFVNMRLNRRESKRHKV